MHSSHTVVVVVAGPAASEGARTCVRACEWKGGVWEWAWAWAWVWVRVEGWVV